MSEGEVRPLAEAAPGVSSSEIAVVDKAMARELEQRYASVAELMEDVEALVDGLTPRAEHASALTRVHRYFTSEHNPDTSHIRVVDMDLTGAAGTCFGAGVTVLVTTQLWWLALALILLAMGLFVAPARAYWRAMRSGHRRLERQRARERERDRAAS